MKPTDNLHQLVKSLTSSEKRYFKVFSKRHVVGDQNKYEQLFDIYDALPDDRYDEDELKQKLKKKNLGKNLADDKKNLQEMIMKAMLSFHSGNSIDNQLNDLLAEEDFYRQKRLNDLRRKTIIRAKEIAEKYEKYTILLTLAERETKMKMELDQDSLPELAAKLGSEEQKYLDKLNQINDLATIDFWLFIQYRINAKVNSTDFWKLAQKKLSHHSFADYKPGESFTSDRRYYSIWSCYYLLKNDFEQYNYYVAKMFDLYEIVFPHQKNNNRILYNVALYNYVFSLHTIRDYEAMGKLLEYAETIAPLNEDEVGEAFQNIIFYKQLLFLNTQQFNKAIGMVEEIETGLKKFKKKINTARILTIYSNISISYMMLHKWDEVLTYTEKIIADKTDVRLEIKYEAMLHQLIARYELKQYDLLSYQIRNTQHLFSSKGILSHSHSYIFKMLNTLIKEGDEYFLTLKDEPEIAIENCKGFSAIQIWLHAHMYDTSLTEAAPLVNH
jgi:hypothetical protein